MYSLIIWFCKLVQPSYLSRRGLRGGGASPLSISQSATMSPLRVGSADSNRLTTSIPSQKVEAELTNLFTGDYHQLPTYVDACYFDWVAGKSDDVGPDDSEFECKLLEYLDTLAESEFAGAKLIPRVPSVMVQLLKRMHEENVSGSELSRIITQDVVLVAALLNEVNSSFYNLPHKINDLSQAILLLGHTRLRMVLAKISFTPIYNAQIGAYTKVSASKIWDQSQKRALACFLLAKAQQHDPFHAFLAGLMQDVGLIVALRVFDRSGNAHLPTSLAFREAFQQRALALSSRIGRIWSLPESVVEEIESQGTLSKRPFVTVLQQGDFLSKISTLVEAGQLTVDMESLKTILTKPEMDCLITLLDGSVSISTIF